MFLFRLMLSGDHRSTGRIILRIGDHGDLTTGIITMDIISTGNIITTVITADGTATVFPDGAPCIMAAVFVRDLWCFRQDIVRVPTEQRIQDRSLRCRVRRDSEERIQVRLQ